MFTVYAFNYDAQRVARWQKKYPALNIIQITHIASSLLAIFNTHEQAEADIRKRRERLGDDNTITFWIEGKVTPNDYSPSRPVLGKMYSAAYALCEDMSTYNLTGDARRHAIKAKNELWILIQQLGEQK